MDVGAEAKKIWAKEHKRNFQGATFMTHTHKFKEIELSIDRLHSVTHWRCIDCNEVWITDNGDEESLPGEILIDDYGKEGNN